MNLSLVPNALPPYLSRYLAAIKAGTERNIRIYESPSRFRCCFIATPALRSGLDRLGTRGRPVVTFDPQPKDPFGSVSLTIEYVDSTAGSRKTMTAVAV